LPPLPLTAKSWDLEPARAVSADRPSSSCLGYDEATSDFKLDFRVNAVDISVMMILAPQPVGVMAATALVMASVTLIH
jgi:hypothetical protein